MSRLADFIIADTQKICSQINFKELFGKTILITGGSGLVGTYLLSSLKSLSKNFNGNFKLVVVVQSDPPDYLKELVNYEGATIHQGDLADFDFCKFLPSANFIIHAAGYAQPGRFLANQEKTLKINTFTTFNLFDKLLPGGKFLFVSSSEVYGGLPCGKYREDQIGNTNTTHPRACYIEGKRCGEAICNAYRNKGINAKSVRLSLAYGPGTKIGDTRVMPSFIEKALKNKKIDLLDEGKAIRTYCYVADVAEIMWQVLFKGTEAIYNVGGFSKITIADLAKKIGENLNVPVAIPITSNHGLAGSPEEVSLDVAKVQNEFGKTEFVSLDDGLKKTIDWYKELFKLF